MPLPSMRVAVRDFLMANPDFSALIQPDRVVYEQPPSVTTPFVTIQIPGNISLSGDGVASRPLAQVDAYCPTSEPAARDIAWDLAAAAGHALGRCRNQIFQDASFSGRLTDGPMHGPADVSRGESAPLARALVRVELTVHSR